MAIHSSTFGRVELSGKDAERFEQQIADTTPNPKAARTVRNGRALVRLMKDKGLYPKSVDANAQ